MRRPGRSLPAATLLRRLGWHHLRVVCRDSKGKLTALHLRRRASDLVEVEFPGGVLARLTNAEAGRLRAALREVLIDERRPYRERAT